MIIRNIVPTAVAVPITAPPTESSSSLLSDCTVLVGTTVAIQIVL